MNALNPSHYAVVDPYPRRLRIEYQGKAVAETEKALILKEVSPRGVYNPVFYIPREDIQADIEMLPELKGTCPIKGRSNHWNLKENPTPMYFGWSYEDPLPGVAQIKGHVTFNLAYVTLVSEPLS